MTSVKNWDKFQHYGNRRPTWIKLYRSLLDDLDWHNLPGDDAKHLVMIWLLAAEDDGNLPPTKQLAFRLRIKEQEAEKLLVRLEQWVTRDASNMLADCYQDASKPLADGYQDASSEESKSKSKNKNRETAPRSSVDRPEGVTEETWNSYIAIRKAKRAPLTATALGQLKAEATKAGWSLEAVLAECCVRGWQAFKAEWVKNKPAAGGFSKPTSHMPNMPLGASSCFCDECVRYRNKKQDLAKCTP